ncbi:MAG: hypothetical protein HGB32_03710 [Geobacteraceae bacterium]|nr:hypothetical protein [Geobacteraceae bacterium]NTW79237.1 hypothetical protein [Geobacteraceae bacterium]
MEMKYIRHEEQGFILWPVVDGDPLWHKHMGHLVTEKCHGGRILSAGFVRFINGKPVCYGESISLELTKHPDDNVALAQQLGI